jgi:hypothetical protein
VPKAPTSPGFFILPPAGFKIKKPPFRYCFAIPRGCEATHSGALPRSLVDVVSLAALTNHLHGRRQGPLYFKLPTSGGTI